MCTLDEGQEAKIEGKAVGDQLTLKGQCTGKLMEVVLNKCVVAKTK